jgi:hypothetical protein
MFKKKVRFNIAFLRVWLHIQTNNALFTQYIVLAYIVNLTLVGLKMNPPSCAIVAGDAIRSNSYSVQVEQYGNNVVLGGDVGVRVWRKFLVTIVALSLEREIKRNKPAQGGKEWKVERKKEENSECKIR